MNVLQGGKGGTWGGGGGGDYCGTKDHYSAVADGGTRQRRNRRVSIGETEEEEVGGDGKGKRKGTPPRRAETRIGAFIWGRPGFRHQNTSPSKSLQTAELNGGKTEGLRVGNCVVQRNPELGAGRWRTKVLPRPQLTGVAGTANMGGLRKMWLMRDEPDCQRMVLGWNGAWVVP